MWTTPTLKEMDVSLTANGRIRSTQETNYSNHEINVHPSES